MTLVRMSGPGFRMLQLVAPILLLWLILIVVCPTAQANPPQPVRKQVLVLHGLWRIRTWEVPFNAALHNAFLTDTSLSVGITHVYLGLDDVPQGEYPKATADRLRTRIARNPMDLVISVLPNANRFLHLYGRELFSEIPLVAVLPHSHDVEALHAAGSTVLFPDAPQKALEKTLASIFSILPDTKTLVVVAGEGGLDRHFLGRTKRRLASAAPDAAVRYLTGMPLEALWSQVQTLPPHSAILYLTYNRDSTGQKHDTTDVARRLSTDANAPVFGMIDTLLGTGIVGGCMALAEPSALASAQTALTLLRGQAPEQIPTTTQILNYGFDANALTRWKISEASLPAGSRIINTRETLWRTYKVHIIAVLGVLLLQALLIVLLVVILVRARRTKHALAQSEARYRTLHDNIPVGLYRTQGDRLVSFNPAALAMFGFDAAPDSADYTPTDFYHQPLHRQEALAAMAADGELRQFEAQLKRRDGSVFWGSVSAARLADTGGEDEVIDGIIQDVSERKHAEAQLLREKRFTEAILDSLPGIFYMYDQDLRLVRWNQSRNIESGYTDAELSQMLLSDFFEGQDLENILGAADQVFKNGEASVEAQVINKDGTKTPYFFTGALLTQDAQPYILGIGTDITDRYRMETSLRNSERRLADIINFLPDATFAIDTEGVVVAWNQAIETMTGVKADEMIGKGNFEYALPFYGTRRACMADLVLNWDDEVAKAYDSIEQEGEILVSVTANPHFRPENTLFWNRARKLYNAEGNVVGAIEVIRDITERKLMGDALRASEHRYRSIVEDQTEFIYRWLPDGTITYANKAYCRFFGITEDECVGANHHPFIHRDDRSAVIRRRAALTPGKPVCTGVHRVNDPGGEPAWHQLVDRAVFDADGELVEYQSVGRDVTENRLAEAALQESEARYRILLEAISLTGQAIILQQDQEGLQAACVYANDAAVLLTGYTREELARMSWYALVHPADRDTVRMRYQARIAGEDLTALNKIAILAKHGREVPVEIAAIKSKYKSRDVVVSFLRDITQRQQAEEALKNSEERFRSLVSNIPGAVYRCNNDHDWTMLYLSDAVTDICGHPATDFIHSHVRTFSSIIHPDDRERVERAVALAIAGKGPFAVEYRIRTAQGKTRWVYEHGTSVVGNDGKAQYLDGAIFDITDRKVAHEALKESEGRLKTLFQSANDAIFIMKDNRIIDCNRKALEIFHCTLEQIVGHPPSKFSPHRQPDGRVSSDKESAKLKAAMNGEPQEFEWLHQRLDGSQFEVQVSLNQVLLRSGPHIQAIVRDITERKQAEAERKQLEIQLRQAQKMEAIGTLAGGIAHDFNNILSAILGFTEVSLRDLPADSKLAANLERVLNAATRAGDLVKQILTFSRQSQKERQPVQIKPIAKEALRLIRASLPASIEIRQRIISDSVIQADPTQIHQIVMNLCTNAAHALPDEAGEIEVRLMDVDEVPGPDTPPHRGAFVRLSVRDNGCGIAPEVEERIFDPFFTTKAQGKGTGLGLSVVHGIVKDCGGWISIDSDPGKGTTFHLFFPVIKSKSVVPTAKAAPLPTGSERILFVDDEEIQVTLGKQVLEFLGYTVVGAACSQEALEILRAAPESFDLLVTDLTMPKMTGDLLAKQILAIRPDLPVILCTGNTEKLTPKKAATLGIKEVVMKPAGVEVMANTVRRVLDRAR